MPAVRCAARRGDRGVAGVLSAFLVNDTICLVMTPLVLDIVRRLKRNPIPYLLAIAMASNVGSVATITGNPQNMIIGELLGRLLRRLSPRRCRRSRRSGCCDHRAPHRARLPARVLTSERLPQSRRARRATQSARHQVGPRDARDDGRCSSPASPSPRSRSSAAPFCCSRAGSSPTKSIARSIGRCSSCSPAFSSSSPASRRP